VTRLTFRQGKPPDREARFKRKDSMYTRQAVQFAVIVVLGVVLCPFSAMMFAFSLDVALGVWGWTSVGMLAGWAIHWWPRTRSLRGDVEIAVASVGSLAGGWMLITLLKRFSASLDERTYHNLAMLSVPMAFTCGVLAVLALRRFSGQETWKRLEREPYETRFGERDKN
jgi:hypothetical protein